MSHAAVAGLEGHAIQPNGAVDGEVSVVGLHGEAAEGVVPGGIGVRHGVLARERERLHLARKCHDGRNGVLGSVCGVAFGRAGLDPRREDIELILRGLVDALEVVLWGAVLSAACAEGRHEEWVCAVTLGLHLREQAGSEGSPGHTPRAGRRIPSGMCCCGTAGSSRRRWAGRPRRTWGRLLA